MIIFTLASSFLSSVTVIAQELGQFRCFKVSYRGSEQDRVRVFQRSGCASALHAPLRQPVEQQQQETPRAHGTCTHQDDLPQAGLVTPHLLHR